MRKVTSAQPPAETASDPFRRVRARLKAWRESSGLKGKKLKELTGMSPAFWSDIETGGKKPKRPDGVNAMLIEALTEGRVRAFDWLRADERELLRRAKEYALKHQLKGGAA